ncbi:MAG: hypothetical protein H6563_00790 [Lewinellaceae bacterium]|nr:hypothetical protein [Lewinellaceae bacterium]
MTTYDMVLISRHVLGLVPLDSPYKRIAADVNRSSGIEIADFFAIKVGDVNGSADPLGL